MVRPGILAWRASPPHPEPPPASLTSCGARTCAPLKGAPAAFLARPIVEGHSRVGAFVLQISSLEIDRVVSGNRSWEADGLGRTGDVEIVGPDRLMRSTSRRFIEHPGEFLQQLRAGGATEEQLRQVQTFGTTILGTKVAGSAV